MNLSVINLDGYRNTFDACRKHAVINDGLIHEARVGIGTCPLAWPPQRGRLVLYPRTRFAIITFIFRE